MDLKAHEADMRHLTDTDIEADEPRRILLEPTHDARFLPQWQHSREVLNRLPVRHERWGD